MCGFVLCICVCVCTCLPMHMCARAYMCECSLVHAGVAPSPPVQLALFPASCRQLGTSEAIIQAAVHTCSTPQPQPLRSKTPDPGHAARGRPRPNPPVAPLQPWAAHPPSPHPAAAAAAAPAAAPAPLASPPRPARHRAPWTCRWYAEAAGACVGLAKSVPFS